MNKELVLKAQPRNNVKALVLRGQEKLPAVLYGRSIKNQNLAVSQRDFQKIYKEAGSSSLVNLIIDSEPPRRVLIHEVQADPISGKFIHADFYQVKMTEKIKAEVSLVFVGASRAVKEKGGVLVKNITELEVEALPEDLPHELIVDISSLKTFEDAVKISDLKLPKGVEVLAEKEEIVAMVSPPRSEEELKALEEEVVEKVEEVAVEKEKKEEEKAEEGKEGEAAVKEKRKSQPESKKEIKK